MDNIESLPPPADDEKTPYKDLTGQVIKLDEHFFAYGGFSEVYRGQWTDPRSEAVHIVAIKSLRGVHTESDKVVEATRRRLNRETRVWHKLIHPNVLPFLGIINDVSPFSALVSPLCEAGEALQYIVSHPEVDRTRIIYGTAKGLEYLHSRGVIHGDIKSRNILIDARGAPRLCDFGRSKVVDHRGYTTIFTGVARYMAPEMLGVVPSDNANEPITNIDVAPVLTMKTDVYAFGMVGLEMLTSKVPYFYLRFDSQVIHQVQIGQPPKRAKYTLPPDTEDIWTIFTECWIQSPDLRPEMSVVVLRMPVD